MVVAIANFGICGRNHAVLYYSNETCLAELLHRTIPDTSMFRISQKEIQVLRLKIMATEVRHEK